jgi:hypothetical protein
VGGLWTGDESWKIWVNPLIGSWMTIEEELPQRCLQAIRATQIVQTVFLNLKEFAPMNLLLSGTSFPAAFFVLHPPD